MKLIGPLPALAVGLCLGGAAGADDASLEYAVKANYLYKLGPFVEWPAGAQGGGAFTICIAGDDPFGSILDEAVRGQAVQGRPVAVRRLTSGAGPNGCHVLYLGRLKAPAQSEMLRAVRGEPVLTVTDARQTGGGRGIVHFVLKDGKVRFSLDVAAAQVSGLTLSSKLLALSVEAPR